MFLGWVDTSKIQQSSLEFPLEGHSWRIHHCVSVIRHLHGADLTTLRVVAVVATWSYDWFGVTGYEAPQNCLC